MLGIVEEFRTKLDTVSNLPKYLRSGRVGSSFTAVPTVRVEVPSTSTIEHVLRNANGTAYSQNEWVVLATQQSITEESYGADTDPITITLPASTKNGFKLLSVLGYPLNRRKKEPRAE